jgi:hypothetical protein
MAAGVYTKEKLVKTKVNNNITLGLPLGFMPIPDSELAQRYPSVRRPMAAYTNVDREADLSINISATQWPDGNIEMASQFFRSSLYYLFDRVQMINEGIADQYGKQFIYFEFESRVEGNRMEIGQQTAVRKYTYIYYLVEPGRTLVFTFNTDSRFKQKWQDTAKNVMESIKVK